MIQSAVEVITVLVALLALADVIRRRRRADSQIQRFSTDPSDPRGPWQQLEERIAQDIGHRTMQWSAAASSVRAARDLEREIKEELQATDEIRRYAAEHRPDDKEGMQDLDVRRRQLEDELERVAGLIRQLRA